MIRPPSLQKGDTVAITCPAKRLPQSIAPAVRLLESWGLRVIIGASTQQSYFDFAGTDIFRAQEFQSFINHQDIKAIFAARGGYGCVRIVDALNFEPLKKHPKWIVGFSDITVLHAHLHRNIPIQTLHAQMPLNIPEASETSLLSLKNALFGHLNHYEWVDTSGQNQSGTAEGLLIGGNLSILTMLENSVSEMDYTDKILFIEDVGEAHYAIDRMLYQMLRSGKLAQLKGLLVGGFSHLRDEAQTFGQNIAEIIKEKVKDFGYPVAFDFPAGHIHNNCALYLGAKAHLKVHNNKTSKLTFVQTVT